VQSLRRLPWVACEKAESNAQIGRKKKVAEISKNVQECAIAVASRAGTAEIVAVLRLFQALLKSSKLTACPCYLAVDFYSRCTTASWPRPERFVPVITESPVFLGLWGPVSRADSGEGAPSLLICGSKAAKPAYLNYNCPALHGAFAVPGRPAGSRGCRPSPLCVRARILPKNPQHPIIFNRFPLT